MRTSNKILLGAFVIAVLIVLGIYAAIYVQYDRANWVRMEPVVEDTSKYEIRRFEDLKFISLNGLQNCTVVPSDAFKVEMGKAYNEKIYCSQSGDLLFISTDSILPNDGKSLHKSQLPVKVYVPRSIEKITARGCIVEIDGNKDSGKAYSQSVALFDTWLYVGQRVETDQIQIGGSKEFNSQYWNQLKIESYPESRIVISDRVRINELRSSLASSVLRDLGCAIQNIWIEADKKSEVTLHGDNFYRAMLSLK
jgi:hypothetical protein